jgi:dTDP-4-dehydrorhamnose reductase
VTTVVVTGASGLLGRALCRELAPRFTVRGLAHHRLGPGLEALDLRDAAAVERWVASLRPDVVVHAAAERRPDVSERDPGATRTLNVDASAVLARAARAAGAWLLYVSTDYVFDGTTPPYRPGDTPNPLNAYGRSKREGELVTLAAHPGACVLRLPILYGVVERLRESAVTDVAATLLESDGPLELDDWAVRRPTDVADVASVCRQLIARGGITGIHHWSAAEAYTKYGMGCLMAGLLGVPAARLVPRREPAGGAPRPRDTTLDCTSLQDIVRGARGRLVDRLPAILRPFTLQSPAGAC